MRGKMVKKLGCLAMAALLFAGGTVYTSAASSTTFMFSNYAIHCGSADGTKGIVTTQAEGGGNIKCMAAVDSYQTMKTATGSVSALKSGTNWQEATSLTTASVTPSKGYVCSYVKGKHKAKNASSTSSVHYTTDGTKR